MPTTTISIPPPKTIKIAIQLMVLAFIDIFLILLTSYASFKLLNLTPNTYYTYSNSKLLIDALLYLIIVGASIYYITQRKWWARIVYVVYTLGHVALNYYAHTLSGNTGVVDVLVFCYYLLLTIIITLLFTSESNAWFRGETPKPLDQSQPLKRPRAVILAIALQIANFALFLAAAVLAYYYYRSVNQPLWHLSTNSTLEILIDTPIHLLIMLVILISLYRQKNWARATYVIYVIYRVLFHFYTHNLMSYTPLIENLVTGFLVLNFSSLTLLYIPSCNAWFKQSTSRLKQ
ncbi:MAG: hypothetical protein P1U34_11110 [Coxiellaceae bacterium]|nr:hypothetical protein [Coxiellaceae bacterium]